MRRNPALQAALARLDAEQAAVAAWTPRDGNLRIPASAGAGKTSTLTALSARLIVDGDVDPGKFVLTAFANRAAKVLQAKIAAYLPQYVVPRLRIGTFHGLGLKALRARQACWEMSRCLDGNGHTRAPGVPSAGVLWRSILEYGVVPGTDAPSLRVSSSTEETQRYRAFHDLCRSYGYDKPADLVDPLLLAQMPTAPAYSTPKALPTGPATKTAAVALRGAVVSYDGAFFDAWNMFNAAKATLQVWDFADVLAAYRDVLASSDHGRDNVVFTDEVQDNSRLQHIIAGLLSDQGGRQVICGDSAQAIFSFRGADPSLFIDAESRLSAKTLPIFTNYRSLPDIVALGNAVVEGRSWKIGPPAVASRRAPTDRRIPPENAEKAAKVAALRDGATTDGERVAAEAALERLHVDGDTAHRTVTALGHADLYDDVACRIRLAMGHGADPGDYAILCRTRSQRSDFAAALADYDIPYLIVGGESLFESKEANVILAYCLLSAKDAYGALGKVLNTPKRFLPNRFAGDVKAHTASGATMLQAIRALAEGSKTEKGARKLYNDIAELRDLEWAKVPDAIGKLLPPTGTVVDGESPDDDRQGLYNAALRIAARCESAEAFVDRAGKILAMSLTAKMEDEADKSRVILSTAHGFKGQEAINVIVYVEAGTFPHSKATDMEDELRLFYVAVTRPRDSLILAYRDKPCEYAIRFAGDVLLRDCGFGA